MTNPESITRFGGMAKALDLCHSAPAAFRVEEPPRDSEVATLGLLALGAPGIPFWRREECESAGD